ncbi:MEMO1 family protein MK0963 [Desulfarculales bacterium]
MLRQPAVAGQFYPGSPAQLRSMVQGFLDPQAAPQSALLVICPHAGYIYSGATTGKVLSQVQVPRRVVVVGPNHRGSGHDAAVMSQGQWQTPLGSVDLDTALGGELLRRCSLLAEDHLAHMFEHSLEVQVPFLQMLQPELSLLPICLSLLSFSECQQIGLSLVQAIHAVGEPVLIVASTDMTHYESAQAAQKKDSQALDRILAMDPKGLFDTVCSLGITMCGVLPTTVCLVAAISLGAASARLVQYTHSGMVTGDHQQVVGYAGLIVA